MKRYLISDALGEQQPTTSALSAVARSWFPQKNQDHSHVAAHIQGSLRPGELHGSQVSVDAPTRREQEVAAVLAHYLDGTPNPLPAAASRWQGWVHKARLACHVLFWPKPYFPIMQHNLQKRLHALEGVLPDLNAPVWSDHGRGAKEQWLRLQKNALLSLLAFTELENGMSVCVPSKQHNGQWAMVRHTVQRIPLTPWGAGPRYNAYGLVPETTQNPDHQVPASVLFMGTCPPGWKGYLWTWFADTLPFTSVGESMFWMGKKRLQAFLKEQHQRTGLKTQCHGQSLGGSMSLHVAHAFPQWSEAYANVPAGTRHPRTINTHAEIICRGQDPVTRMGHMPTGSDVHYWYEVLPEDNELSPQERVPQNKTSEPLAKHPINQLGALSQRYSHVASLSHNAHTHVLKVKHSFFQQAASRKLWHRLHRLSWVLGPLFVLVGKVIALPVHLVRALYSGVAQSGRWLINRLRTPQHPTDNTNARLLCTHERAQGPAFRTTKVAPSPQLASDSKQEPHLPQPSSSRLSQCKTPWPR